ncbi:hypothetical protein [uncultured Tateyamaria sp.]|uniref:hypothetical protein n=1 Tax=uncultured Tateyamaria sp. TaxID=455651 RepID=UPI00260FCE48|nr:hypothetical protein [uncultured Tateyamaria sp.]
MFDLTTQAADFVVIFWLSIAAESIIRWAENTNFIASLSKPFDDSPRGDNQDFRLKNASSLLILVLCLMFFLNAYLERYGVRASGLQFMGQNGDHSPAAFEKMVQGWLEVAANSNVYFPMLFGTLLRAKIYKRSHSALEDLGGDASD